MEPSADQLGSKSTRALCVSCTWFDPSGFMTKISASNLRKTFDHAIRPFVPGNAAPAGPAGMASQVAATEAASAIGTNRRIADSFVRVVLAGQPIPTDGRTEAGRCVCPNRPSRACLPAMDEQRIPLEVDAGIPPGAYKELAVVLETLGYDPRRGGGGGPDGPP